MAKFVISKRTNGEFQFSLKDDSGKILLGSEGYTTHAAVKNGVESVKKNALIEAHIEKKESSNGKFFFNVKASNGQVVATSHLHDTDAHRAEIIEAIKEAEHAPVEDETV
ncbi:hypothetical protein A9P82_01585 [Arachidicoccus ginsenosidimutans]|uniref:YegP family protein n=1 Tax=Arachidicoccus sp. BS20 TaxID=1850526 RepID=UPI0007F0A07F|nr:YegP family protein [Arachidicoccus sp. BS20]ANI88116.1 hypothetical protein A9P82_01585 [Arachidicoccus sp. BS20]